MRLTEQRISRSHRWIWTATCLCLGLLTAGRVSAQPMDVEDLPPELRPWVPWVLDGLGDELCPVVHEQAVCAWPGSLSLELTSTGGTFRQRVVTDRRVHVSLPGSTKIWPQQVEVDGEGAVVVVRDDRPHVLLRPGQHRVEGRFRWQTLPEVLPIPQQTARILLTIDEQRIVHPRRSDEGDLWLRAGAAPSAEPERLELEVFRRIDDGVPLLVTTRLDLRVAGRAREVNLGKVGLEGSTPLSLTSKLPMRLEAGQVLLVQVSAGQHSIELTARFDTPPESLELSRRGAPWPEREIWAWAPDDELRQVKLSGAPSVDPARTNLPTEWRQLQAFSLQAPVALRLETIRRGEPSPPPNRMTLRRELWLDLDGAGYTVRDRLQGQLYQRWRLDLQRGVLGHVTTGGTDQLITVDAASATGGVELRQGALDVMAEWRLEEATSHLPAVGWSEDVQRLSTTLRLPPGWRLLGASGVDKLSHSWLGSWNLFDAFFVLLVALAVARLTKPTWGVVALAALVLCHDVQHAPRYVWIVLLALFALLRVLPAGRLRNGARVVWWGTAATVVVLTIGFSVAELRVALFPQTTTQYAPAFYAIGYEKPLGATVEAGSEVAAPSQHAVDDLRPAERTKGKSRRVVQQYLESKAEREVDGEFGMVGLLQEGKQSQQQLWQDPKAIIQTGPGVPEWTWQTWHLGWSGPVDRAHTIRLFLLSPWQSAVVSLLRVALMGLLAYLLLRASPIGPLPPSQQARRGRRPRRTVSRTPDLRRPSIRSRPLRRLLGALGGALVATALLTVASSAAADGPRSALLDELKTRLTRQAACTPDCVTVPQMKIVMEDDTLRIETEVHAGATASYQLPGPANVWVPRTVGVGGEPSHALALLTDGFVHLRLPPGRHEVKLSGPVAGDSLTLTLGTKPYHVEVDAPGWQVDGLGEDGRVDGSMQLTRKLDPGQEPAAEPGSGPRLPPWLSVQRVFQIGVTWSVLTSVKRVSPVGTPIVARLPLLAGEEVTEADVLVEGGEVVVSFDRTAEQVTFRSSLKPTAKLTLEAAQGRPWTETWIIDSGPIWHVAAEGFAPVEHQHEGIWRPLFQPWPGEKLALTFQRPDPAPGQSVTIDEAVLTLTPGTRLEKAQLALRIRNSSGGTQTLQLPGEAKIQNLTVDGTARPIQRQGDAVAITLTPGKQYVELQWQQPGGLSPSYRAPRVSLGTAAVNGHVTVELPSERWLLLTGGPSWGPAVLFWGYLLLILIAVQILVRLPYNPLTAWQWALLGVGLTQVPALVALAVAGWFFLLSHRRGWKIRRAGRRNLAQAALLLSTALFVLCLIQAVYSGLVGSPDMAVAGYGSSATRLSWYVDRFAETLPQPWVLSAPVWLWRVLMLAWALWLAYSLLRWLRWGWEGFTTDGAWRKMSFKRRRRAAATAAAASGPSTTAELPDDEAKDSPSTESDSA